MAGYLEEEGEQDCNASIICPYLVVVSGTKIVAGFASIANALFGATWWGVDFAHHNLR